MGYYNVIVTMSKTNYAELEELYNTKAKPVYNRIVKQSQLFYDDVKQPTIDVTNHYKAIATSFVNKYYTKYEKIVKEQYYSLKAKAEGKLEGLKTEIENQYQKFLSKYGDMTWEQVGEELVKFAQEKYALAKKEYTKNSKKAEKLAAEYKKKAEELYKKAEAQYEKYMAKFENEIKPKVMAKYEEIKAKVETLVAEYKVKATKLYNMKSQEATDMAKKYYKKLNTVVFDTILP